MTMAWARRSMEKDLRALLPVWCVFAITMPIAAGNLGPSAALLIYLLGCSLLGALVIGHEFSNRTLPGLLTLPVGRRPLLIAKLSVLALMLAGLAAVAVAWDLGTTPEKIQKMEVYLRLRPNGMVALLLPPLCGLCLAPWLTMLGRSPLAGAVFACATLCTMWFAGEVIGLMRFGPGHAEEVWALRGAIAWNGTLTACAVGAIGTWMTFARLEASETRSLPIDLRRWIAPATASEAATPAGDPRRRRGHWAMKLGVKEIRLHSLALVIGALYVLSWYVIVSTRSWFPEQFQLPLGMVTLIFGGVVSVVIGSFATAEERHLGTASWQGLLPVPAWRQWTIKLVVVLTMAQTIGVGLPWLLQQVTPGLSIYYDVMLPEQPLLVLLLTIGAAYVSSCSTTGLRAIVASIAVLTLGAWLAKRPLLTLTDAAATEWLPILRRLGFFRHFGRVEMHPIVGALPAILVVLAVLLVLRFAFINHRSTERSQRRFRTQGIAFLCMFLFAGVVLGAGRAVTVRAWRYTTADDGVQVRGRAVFEGATPAPSALARDDFFAMLIAEVDDGRGSIFGEFRDGQFITPFFYPDRYRLLAVGGKLRETWTFKGATYQGRDITDTSIDIRASLDGVVLTFTDNPGTLAGHVKNPDGTDGWGAVVVMFPVNQSAWQDYGWASRRVRVTGLNPDRSEFTWTMPPDGEYQLVAVPRDAVKGMVSTSGGFGRLRIEKDPSALFTKLALIAERIQAREGETLKVVLTVRQ